MRNLRLALLALIAVPMPALGEPPAAAPGTGDAPLRVLMPYRVKQQGGGLGNFVDEAAVFYEVGRGPGRIWIVERRRRDQKMGKVSFRYDWIDGRGCPALEGVIADLARLPPAGMAGLLTEPRGWVSDIPYVTLIGPPAGGQAGDILLRRDLDGPVSRWWRSAEGRLADCWRPDQPYVANAYDLRPHLASARDEVEVMGPD